MTKQYVITEAKLDAILSRIGDKLGHANIESWKNDILQSLPELTGEPVEYLLDGMRVKLNFNKMGNMTSLRDMEHELQGRWVCFVGAENDKHLNATSPHPLQPITADDVTEDMRNAFRDGDDDAAFEDINKCLAAAINAYLKHIGDTK